MREVLLVGGEDAAADVLCFVVIELGVHPTAIWVSPGCGWPIGLFPQRIAPPVVDIFVLFLMCATMQMLSKGEESGKKDLQERGLERDGRGGEEIGLGLTARRALGVVPSWRWVCRALSLARRRKRSRRRRRRRRSRRRRWEGVRVMGIDFYLSSPLY